MTTNLLAMNLNPPVVEGVEDRLVVENEILRLHSWLRCYEWGKFVRVWWTFPRMVINRVYRYARP